MEFRADSLTKYREAISLFLEVYVGKAVGEAYR